VEMNIRRPSSESYKILLSRNKKKLLLKNVVYIIKKNLSAKSSEMIPELAVSWLADLNHVPINMII